MKPEQHRETLTTLSSLLSGMDLPDHRRRPQNRDGLRWLSKCLAQRNSAHPDFGKACSIMHSLGFHVMENTR